jgi:hypothetical protein
MTVTRYFFNVRSENTYIRDAEGQEHADLGAAKQEAKIAAREMLAETVKRGHLIDNRRFEITDDSGTVCATVPFRDVLRFS